MHYIGPMKRTKDAQLVFRLTEPDSDEFRRLTEAKGGYAEVLRRYIRRYIKRHKKAA